MSERYLLEVLEEGDSFRQASQLIVVHDEHSQVHEET